MKNQNLQNEIDDANIFRANFSSWSTHVDENVSCIIFLTLVGVAVAFLVVGLIKRYLKKKWEKDYVDFSKENNVPIYPSRLKV